MRQTTTADEIEAARDLAEAAEELYYAESEARGLEAVLRAEKALARAGSACDADARLAARVWLSRAREGVLVGGALPKMKIRAAANRLYEAALLMLEGAVREVEIHLMLVRLLLREVELALLANRPADVAKSLVFAQGAWRAILLSGCEIDGDVRSAFDSSLAALDEAASGGEGVALPVAAAEAARVARAIRISPEQPAGETRPS